MACGGMRLLLAARQPVMGMARHSGDGGTGSSGSAGLTRSSPAARRGGAGDLHGRRRSGGQGWRRVAGMARESGGKRGQEHRGFTMTPFRWLDGKEEGWRRVVNVRGRSFERSSSSGSLEMADSGWSWA